MIIKKQSKVGRRIIVSLLIFISIVVIQLIPQNANILSVTRYGDSDDIS